MASAILIILFIVSELSFDRFHENRERIHRLYIDINIGEQTYKGAWTSMVMAPTFTWEIPEIENFTRFDVWNQQLIWFEDKKYIEDNFMFADSSVFDIFSVNFVRGVPETALTKPRSIVITREKANQYFGDRDPLGLPLTINSDSNIYIVTGVIESFPENSHFYTDFIASMVTLDDSNWNIWFQNSIISYVLLQDDSDFKMVEKKMNQVLQKHITPQLHSILGVSPEEWADGGNRYEVYLQPLTDIHLNPDIELGVEICFRPVHDRNYIYIFAVIAFFILIIAGINFTNLSTARSVLRSREIGLRKAVGSQRTQIIWQFLAESVLLSLISLMVALFIVEISLPWFNRTMDLNLSFDTVGKWFMIMAVILLSIFIGLLSGIYPALFVARYRPIEGIKGLIIGGKGSGVFRRVMVIIQFSISVMIIIGTFIVFTQLNLLLNKDMGFDKDNLVVVSRVYPLGNKIETFCREVEKYPEVKSASNSSAFLGFTNTTESFRIKGRDISKNYLFATNYVDPSFLQTYNLKLVNRDSRFFNPDVSSDSSAILVNRAAVREYGMTDPLKTTILEQTIEGDTNELHIIGVLEDFHHNSLKDKIMPYMLRYKGENTEIAGYITIRMSDDRRATGRALKKIEDLWLSMTNDEPFQFFFLDEEIDNYYKEERRTGRLSLMFAILATLIACLGLFGLTLYNTQRRVREIGIRKAMGASIGNIIYLVSKEVMVMMFFSVIFAWLAAYLLMQELWLQDFPYNIGFRPWIYLISAVTALIIALITVAGMAYSSAVTNPSEALHYE